MAMFNNADAQNLGTIIGNRNIYPKDRAAVMGILGAGANLLTLGVALNDPIEEDSYEIGDWKFRGQSHRIAKAIRIPYTYTDENGNAVREYLLVGYEGEGGE